MCGDNLATFDYAISDGNGGTDSASATVDITCVNDDPVAVDDDASGTEDADVTIPASDLVVNDTDEDSDHGDLKVTGVSNGVGGTASLDSGTITFTPDADVCGDVTFDYTVEDGDGGSDTGTVTIDLTCVNEQPVANDDTLNGTEDTDVTATEGDLTGNDTDVDGDSLTSRPSATRRAARSSSTPARSRSRPTRMPATRPSSASTTTSPTASDGTDTGHVVVNISCENDNPAATDDDASGTEDQDVTITASDLAGDDTDAEGDSLTVTGVTNAEGGTVSLDSGTITFTPTPTCAATTRPPSTTRSRTATAAPPPARSPSTSPARTTPRSPATTPSSVTEDTRPTSPTPCSTNDTDVDTGDTLSIDAVDERDLAAPSSSTAAWSPSRRPTCAATARPASTTTLSDGTTTDTGHVTVDITCVNDDPGRRRRRLGHRGHRRRDHGLRPVRRRHADVRQRRRGRDRGLEPRGGTVSLESGTITFVPTANLCGDDVASFDYTVEDGDGGADTGTVTIDLTCVNDAPDAVNDTASIDANSAAADHDVLANDEDVDAGDTLTLESAVVDAAKGTASVVAGKVQLHARRPASTARP